jgi:hypothetical protein
LSRLITSTVSKSRLWLLLGWRITFLSPVAAS